MKSCFACYTATMNSRPRNSLAAWFVRLAALCCATTIVVAQDSAAPSTTATQYDIELIVFQNLSGNASPEDWALEDAAANRGKNPAADNAVEDSLALTDNAPGLQALPSEQFKLNALAGGLRASRGYRVLAHTAWTQSAVPLRSGAYTALTTLFPNGSPLAGGARLSRGSTLHLALDLRLNNPDGPRYVLRQTRQIKRGERHYFDHPHFGVIATVNVRRM